MRPVSKIARYLRLCYRARNQQRPPAPPFLVLFINSACNMRCDHCFVWDSLNRRDDLTLAEIRTLSQELGPLENLNLSGGEPFLRADFAEVCAEFIRNNQTRQIYCPTNGWYTERMESELCRVLMETGFELFTVELSVDGMADFHDSFRGKPGSFSRLMETYDMLAALHKEDPRLQIHAITTATAENIAQVIPLSRFLHERCPAMNRHNIALLRGGHKRASLIGPSVSDYLQATREVSRIWVERKDRSSARVIDPMLHLAKAETHRRNAQAVRCRAGILTGVVYANGDVSLCEQHVPLGNLRAKPFLEIWYSAEAAELRRRIWEKQCSCTNEIFLWSSLVFQPVPLIKALRATGTFQEALVTLVH